MNTREEADLDRLTEREKQTLRLIVRGHDAKSIARTLGLSVHTINERLRDARRKMAVSSSREAARLLFKAEEDRPTPHLLGDSEMGGDDAPLKMEEGAAPASQAAPAIRRPWIIGVLLMPFFFGLLALAALPQIAPGPPANTVGATVSPDPALAEFASRWLALLDQKRWEESYRATGASFRQLNTFETWAALSEQVHLSMGSVVTRSLLSVEQLPAPPHGYQVVKFRTSFAKKADSVETVTLERENGAWRVVGVTID